jgi:hypothetical protein
LDRFPEIAEPWCSTRDALVRLPNKKEAELHVGFDSNSDQTGSATGLPWIADDSL